MNERFRLRQVPIVESGPGTFSSLVTYLNTRQKGERVLCIVSPSAGKFPAVQELFSLFKTEQIPYIVEEVSGEPGVKTIDDISARHLDDTPRCVVGIGGGSVLDTAKAVSVMIHHRRTPSLRKLSVKSYLEGVGELEAPSGRDPLILIPTTAGTGSESTTNAVISQVGPGGFKKSLRHDSYLCDLAILDPALLEPVPLRVLVASGMDALTQLLESYFSTSTNAYIDSLVLGALKEMPYALIGLIEESGKKSDHLSILSYGAFISGIGISHAGLGYVHGLSGPMGSIHQIPHGLACALLIAKTNRAMFTRAKKGGGDVYLTQLHRLALAWNQGSAEQAIELLEQVEQIADLRSAGSYGFTREDMDTIDVIKARRNAPIALDPHEVRDILYSLI